MGRPPKKIDETLVEKLAAIHCSIEEIASICECSRDTIERRFAAKIEKARATGKSSLRRLQWESAQKGNVTMQIWLGKQLLGQKDKADVDHSVGLTLEQFVMGTAKGDGSAA
jgi:hypothetical protein